MSAPDFTIVSPDFSPGYTLPQWMRSGIAGVGGEDRSPTLHWEGAPSGTRSFALTVFDPDASHGGFWHWALVNLPAKLESLPQNAGDPDAGLLPAGTITLANSADLERFLGAAPPSGTGDHHYIFTLSALDIERLEVSGQTTAADVDELIAGHVVATAQLVGLSHTD